MEFSPVYRDLPTFRLAGLRQWHSFADAPRTIPDQWDQFKASRLPGAADAQVTYGATCQMDMPNQRFEYLAGCEVPDFEDIPTQNRMIVPEAHYAVFTLNRVEEIPPFWRSFFASWAPASGKKLNHDAPNFERYDERFDPKTRGPLEIWIPVHP
jgi:AraC family transcriptional regulator